MVRAPQYRPTLADPYRDHLRARRAEDPAVPVLRLLAGIGEPGYAASMNLLYRYISQGRVESDRPHLSSRPVTRLLLTRPGVLSDAQQALLTGLTAACPEMTSLAGLARSFAALLKPDPGNDGKLQEWARAAQAADPPSIHAFTPGLHLGMAAATAAVTLPFHNGRAEGVNTKTKMIKRQMYGRAGFTLPPPPHPAQLTTHRHHRKCDRPGFRTPPITSFSTTYSSEYATLQARPEPGSVGRFGAATHHRAFL